jgi:hypothetical protein
MLPKRRVLASHFPTFKYDCVSEALDAVFILVLDDGRTQSSHFMLLISVHMISIVN